MDWTSTSPPNLGVYPEPYIVLPLSDSHRQTLIILHGRGDKAENFATLFLMWSVPHHGNIRGAFPHAKFAVGIAFNVLVFPTAAPRRAALSNGAITSQWFDSGHPGLQQGRQYDDLQVEGLRESTKFLHDLVEDAIAEVGASNVVVGGLSQGGATSMAAMLLWNREPIAAWFGLCTRVPFCNRIQEALGIPEHKEDVFELDPNNSNTEASTRLTQAQEWLAEVLDFKDPPAEPGKENDGSRGPIFFGHGTNDTLVPMKLGQDTTRLFKSLDLDVSWNQYKELEHWYSDAMLKDLVEFIAARL